MHRGRISKRLLILLVLILGVIFWRVQGRHVDLPPLPSPNAYDLLVEAGHEVVNVPDVDLTTANATVLQGFVRDNQAALSKIHEALPHESRVPMEFSSDWVNEETKRIGGLRQAARLLTAQARLAEGDPVKAASLYGDLIRLARCISHGGVVVHRMVGAAYERAAWKGLNTVASSTLAEQRPEILEKLKTLSDMPREPLDELFERERRVLGTGFWSLIRFGPGVSPAIRERLKAIEAELTALQSQADQALMGP